MEKQFPVTLFAAKQVGANGAHHRQINFIRGNILEAGDCREMGAGVMVNARVGGGNRYRALMTEYGFPAAANRFPTSDQIPARMDALGILALAPNLCHQLQVGAG